MIRVAYILVFLILGSWNPSYGQTEAEDRQQRFQKYVLYKVNQLRTEGCRCGRKRMKATHALTWNETLAYSAYLHAEEMDRYDYFAHKSIDGKDIGQRLDKIGYKWQYVGENLAVGQDTFEEAFQDWIDSPSHCKMLMNPDMKEMGLSKYGEYWVHHFGTQMPNGTRRVRTYYKEG